MNQILFGNVLIDTDEIVCAFPEARTDEVTRVHFKNGQSKELHGDAKVAFDAWAEGRKEAGAKGKRPPIVFNPSHLHKRP